MIAPVESRRSDNVVLIAQEACRLAVRVLFIAANIWIATLFPPAWHWVAVPLFAVGSTALAAFFYPPASSNAVRRRDLRMPCLFPGAEPLWPAHYPERSAVGYRNAGNNCAFNAIAHFIDSDPMLAEWVRHPITAMNLDQFCEFLRAYDVPWIEPFQAFAEGKPQPAMEWLAFLGQYQPQEGEPRVDAFRASFENLFMLQPILAAFYEANDAAIAAHQSVSQGNTATWRRTLAEISPVISADPRVQEDAPAIFDAICSLLPPRMRPEVEIQRHLRMQGIPALREGENLPQRQVLNTIQLHFMEGEERPTLEALLQRYCDRAASRDELPRYLGVDGREHTYPLDRVETRFLRAPPSLHFQLVRMGHERPPASWLNRLLPRWFPPLAWRGIKNQTPVQVPERITVGERHYQLRSFVTHHGGFGGGHYTAGEIRGNHQFLEDDSRVTLVESEAHQALFRSHLEQAYLLCYVPV